MSQFLKYALLLCLSMFFLWTCASERAISGGPEDKEAPEVIHSNPANESVNVDPQIEVRIKFNEQMKQATLKSAIQIWPRPPGGYEIRTSWTWVKLKFNEPLAENETYLITIDKSAQDLRGNGLAATYVQAFTTGEDLNGGHLAGRIQGGQEIRKNGDLLLYRQSDLAITELMKNPADYVFQPDDDGNFELSYLAEQSYMLFYHWDQNKNKLIDGDDYFGRPEKAQVVARSDSLINYYPIWPQLIPPQGVKLLGLNELEEGFLQIRLGRPVNFPALNSIELFVDSIQTAISGVTTVSEDKYAFNIDLKASPKEGAQVWIKNFRDTSGFSLDSDTLQFIKSAEFDSLSLTALQVSWQDRTMNHKPDEPFNILIQANLPIDFISDSAFQLVDQQVDSIRISGSLNKLSSMSWEYLTDSVLMDKRTYRWQIETQYLEAPLNSFDLDSLMQGNLTTGGADSLGSLQLMQMGTKVMECRLVAKDFKYTFSLYPGTPVLIDNLIAQQYFLSAYIDRDKNGRFDSGGLEPASGSEPFWFYPDEIKVRARWETDLGIWKLK